MKLLSNLSGDDIFISYSRKDGSLYAAGLADKLTEKHFSCFIDRYGVKPGHDLPADLIKNIRSSSMMVVVGTKMAASSEFVRQEVKIFKETGRIILPVDFDDNVGKSIWYADIPGLASETEESSLALENGHPSENVINFIEKSFNYTRRNQHMARLFQTAIAIFVILVALGIGGFAVAKSEANKARAEAQDQKLRAETARLAREEAETATNRQIALVAAKTREANAAIRLADQQKQAKEVAERQRIEAQINRDEARKDATEQQKQANIHLAENYYNIAETESKMDPLRALPWLEKAIETDPETDTRFDAYRLRALHKTRFANFSVLNTDIVGSNSRRTTFSPDLNLIFFTTGQTSSLWDIRNGKALAMPPAVAEGNLNVDRLAFSADGAWAAALLGEKNLDEDSKKPPNKQLYVWDIHNPRNCLDIRSPDLQTGFTLDVKFSPDSRFVIVNLLIEKKVKLISWEILTGRELKPFSSDLHLDESPPEKKDRTTIRDLRTAIRKFHEFTNIPTGKTPAANLIITFENEVNATIAELRNISFNSRVEKKIHLEKYIDFIDFTGSSERLITLSHNPSKERVLRIWDVATGTVIKEVESFKSNVIALNRTGDKMVTVPDVKSELQVYSIEKGETQSIRAYGDNEALDYLARFVDDDRYVVVITQESASRLDRLRGPSVDRSFLTVWDIGVNHYVGERILVIDPLEGFHGFSESNKSAGFVNDNGAVTVRRLVPAQAFLQRQLGLPPGDDSYYFDLRSNDAKTFIAIRHVEGPGSKWGDCEISRWDVDLDSKQATRKWRQQVKNASPGFRSISPDNKRFILARGEGEIFEQSHEFSIVDLSGKETPKDVSIDQGRRIIDLEFDRSGSKIIGAIEQGRGTASPEIHRWDSSTGNEDTSRPPLKLRPSPTSDSRFLRLGLTRYGEYLVETPPTDSSGYGRDDTFLLVSTESTQGEFRSLRFSDHDEAILASQLLKQAEKITNRGADLLVAINPDLTIELRKAGNRFSILNKKTGSRIVPPGYSFDTAKISPDGRFVVVQSRGTSSVWSAETGSLITDRIGEADEDIFVDFLAGGSSVVTISSKGSINTWLLGKLDRGVPLWVRGMGSALTGLEINESLEMVTVPQERLMRIRKDYIKKLEEAVVNGDEEAKYILANLKP